MLTVDYTVALKHYKGMYTVEIESLDKKRTVLATHNKSLAKMEFDHYADMNADDIRKLMN